MTTTTMPTKDATVAGLLGEYRAFGSLLRSLNDDEWRTRTRCDGWEARDVCGHVVGLASDSFNGRIGRFTAEEQAAQRRDAKPSDLADELDEALGVAQSLLTVLTDEQWDSPSGAPDLSIGDGLLTLWYDSWVHRDDVNAAIRRPVDRDAGLDAAVTYLRRHLAHDGWTAPAGVQLDSLDPHDFVLAATGRTDPAPLGLDESVNIYR